MKRATRRLSNDATKGLGTARLHPSLLRCFVAPSLILLLTGCTDNQKSPTTRPLTMEERQSQMINDPFNSNQDNGKVDISGGDIWHLDKDAFKKDVDHVLSP